MLRLFSKHTNNQTNLIELWVECEHDPETNAHAPTCMHCEFQAEFEFRVLINLFLQRFNGFSVDVTRLNIYEKKCCF